MGLGSQKGTRWKGWQRRGVTGERGRVCEVYLKKKALMMEPRVKAGVGLGRR